jgi:hypothetical protein
MRLAGRDLCLGLCQCRLRKYDRKAGADDHGGSEQMHYAFPQLILHAGKQACPTYHAAGAIQGIPGTVAAARVWREHAVRSDSLIPNAQLSTKPG